MSKASDFSVQRFLETCALTIGIDEMIFRPIRLGVCLFVLVAAVGSADGSDQDTIAKANGLIQTGQIQQAEDLLRSALERDPQSEQLHEALGELFFERREFEDAVRELTLALRINPDSRQYGMLLALSLINWQHFGVAVDFLNAMQRRFGAYPEFHYYLGFAYFNMNRVSEAKAEFEQTMHISPGFDRAEFLLAKCHLAQGKNDEALAAYRNLVRQRPNNANYWATLAETLERLGDKNNPEALRAGREALALAPNNATALFATGTVLSRIGDFASARLLYERLERLDPTAIAPHAALARIYSRLEERNLARKETDMIDKLQRQKAFEKPCSGLSETNGNSY